MSDQFDESCRLIGLTVVRIVARGKKVTQESIAGEISGQNHRHSLICGEFNPVMTMATEILMVRDEAPLDIIEIK